MSLTNLEQNTESPISMLLFSRLDSHSHISETKKFCIAFTWTAQQRKIIHPPHSHTSTKIFFNVLRGHINTLKTTVNHFYIVNPAVVRYQTSFLLYGRQLKNLFEYFRKFIYVHFIKLFGFCTPEVVSTIRIYTHTNMGATKTRKTNNTKPNG